MSKAVYERLLGFSALAVALATSSIATAQTLPTECGAQPGDISIVGVAVGKDASDAGGGNGALVFMNQTEHTFRVWNCVLEVTSGGTTITSPLRSAAANASDSHTFSPNELGSILLTHRDTWVEYWTDHTDLFPIVAPVNNPQIFYPSDSGNAINIGLKEGAHIRLLNDSDEVIASVAWGNETTDDGFSLDPSLSENNLLFPRNQHILFDDGLRQNPSNWRDSEEPLMVEDPSDPTALVPGDILWPLTPQVPLLEEIVCGDLVTEGDEECDGQHGCSETCEALENWSCAPDADSTNDEIVCEVLPGWECDALDPTDCQTVCGDGILAGEELCDDGNTDDGDGCSSTCAIEDGWTCSGEPSECSDTPPAATCGDGVVQAGEACDDGNTRDSDGCSSSCTVEDGWACSGEPSSCTRTADEPVCGNGIVERGEACDGHDSCNEDCTWLVGSTGGRVGSCAVSTGSTGLAAIFLMMVGLISVRQRRKS